MTENPTAMTLLGKNPLLIPTHSLEPDEFEDFTERLLSAHRFCSDSVRHVVMVERWGRKGDKQHGIDFKGTWSDGKTAAWQCKRYDDLSAADVRAAVKACSFEADEHYLTYSAEASSLARIEIAKHEGWQLLDRRGLGRMLEDLPLHKRRQVLDATWGVPTRKLLLEVPGEDAFLTLGEFSADRQDQHAFLNDCSPLVGRDTEFESFRSSMNRSDDWPPVVLITGPGGRGKTRLVTGVLEEFENENPTCPVICLAKGRSIDSEALRELPHTPAVIVVDDAHRDPSSLAPLLQYLRRTEGTQLVLGLRGTGMDQVRGQIVESGLRPNQVETIEVMPLTLRQARALVTSLSTGLNISAALHEHLAQEATDNPYIAVLALNMARQGALAGPLALDHGLREQVMVQYQSVLVGNIDQFDSDTVGRTLAVYAALGPVDSNDQALRTLIADFCGLQIASLLRLLVALKESGTLITSNGLIRVAPDLLADHVLDRESAVDGQDTGFAADVWRAFGTAIGLKLAVTLAELDWRLTNLGGPSVVQPVWSALSGRISDASLEDLYEIIDGFEPLAYTQPRLLVGLLDQIRTRLHVREAQPGDAPHEPTIVSEDSPRRAFGLPDIGVIDVAQRLPKLYGLCAANSPDVLETILDSLWDLRRTDSRQPHQYPDHPERVVADGLANLGDLPDPSFPTRIIGRVRIWLAEPQSPNDASTPMFALDPLLKKEGARYEATGRREVSISSFFVSAGWARPVRDEIRALLVFEASGADHRRAAVAVDLLGDALRQPAGMFGQSTSGELLMSWEDDDLETVAALRNAANSSASGVIRRIIRRQIEWSAQYSNSLLVRHSSLGLLVELDDLNDDLPEALLQELPGLNSHRGQRVPDLEEFSASVRSDQQVEQNSSEAEQESANLVRIQNQLARRDAEADERRRLVLRNLLSANDIASAVEELNKCCRDIQAARPEQQSIGGLWALLRLLALERPEIVAEFVRTVAVQGDGPLDEGLTVLLDAWQRQAQESLLAWLESFTTQRPGVRLAIAASFDLFGWTDRGQEFRDLFMQGLEDPDDQVRERFLASSHGLLLSDPATTVELLLTSNISAAAAVRALEGASQYEGSKWGQGLSAADADAVLLLAKRTGWRNRTVQLIAAGIALNHPKLVLDHFVSSYESLRALPTEVQGLALAFDQRGVALVEWMVSMSQQPKMPVSSTVVALAIHDGMTPLQSTTLVGAVDAMDMSTLLGVLDLLSSVPAWALPQPELADKIVSRASHFGAEAVQDVLARLERAMQVLFWTGGNGVSEELESALAAASRAVLSVQHPALRERYSEAAAHIQGQAAADKRMFEADEDE